MAVVVAVSVVVVPVAVVMFVELVVVVATAVIAVPVAFIEALAIVARTYPARACVRRPGPIPVMPPIVAAHWIPISFHPDEFGTGTRRKHADYTWRRRGSDSNADGYLAEHDSSGQKR